MKHERCAPVGVFDSGVGGLSVLRHIRQNLPHESLIYVADSGYAPYGDKSAAIILERSIAVTEFLLDQGIKALVVACNTATASAIQHLRQRYPGLIIIGMEPGLKPAAQISKTKKVGVLATKFTIQSEKYRDLRQQLTEETNVTFISQACVGLVDQIEKMDASPTQTRKMLEEYLLPLLDAEVDTLVLGCTHYPFVADVIMDIAHQRNGKSKPVQLIDTGDAVSARLQHLLSQKNLNADGHTASSLSAYASGNAERLKYAFHHWLRVLNHQLQVFPLPSVATSIQIGLT